MVSIADLSPRQKLYVMESGRYSIRNAEVFDDVTGRFVNVDEIMTE
jgi:hypothetical protein